MGKTKWKNQWQNIGGASDFHNRLKTLFRTVLPFKNYKCYQEVAVIDLVPDYNRSSEHYDWYIADLNLIIELHGKQHYEVVSFGKTDGDKAQRDLYRMQERDTNKQLAAINNGYSYLAIPYWEKLTDDKITNMIMDSI
jgi:hypothetical protein